jgi:hypothetical protein
MKRLGRWLFNFMAAVSLVLGVVTAGLWTWSLFELSHVEYHNRDSRNGVITGWVVSCKAGMLVIAHTRDELPLTRDGATWLWYTEPVSDDLSLRDRLGLRLPESQFVDFPSHGKPFTHIRTVWVPSWLLLLICAPTPLVWWIRRARTRRRRAEGCCQKCGYDLRATPDRCPECGTVPATRQGERQKGLNHDG